MASLEGRFAGTVVSPRGRTRWLLRLRWVATVCLLAAVEVARFALRAPLPLLVLHFGIATLVLSNLLYTLWFRRLDWDTASGGLPRSLVLFINLQIAVDLFLLAYLLYFSGGIGNPFASFFVFHMVIASILLPRAAAYLQASWATVLFAVLLFGDAFGFLPAYRVGLFVAPEVLVGSAASAVGWLGAFAATLFITVYLTTSIAKTLRERELQLKASVDDLVVANARLNAKDREKSLYVQRVSHDIKGSLSAIQSCLRVVLDGLLGTVGSRAEELIARAERRSLSLLRYADELLYLSALRTEKRLTVSVLRAAEVVAEVAAELGPALEAKRVALKVEDESGGTVLRADRELFGELIRQLLDNAIKYTPRGGRVGIRLSRAKHGSGLELEVADSGVGVRTTDLPHLFEDFYSADIPENREGTGAGLGLAIVRQIAVAHGGGVTASGRPGKGSTFTCAFPVEGPEKQGGS